MPPPNSVWKISRKLRVDRLEGLGESSARLDVDLLDRLLGVADRIEQVLALRVQEVVALLRFLVLLQRLRIHRAQRLDAGAATPLYLSLGLGEADFVESRFVRRRRVPPAARSVPCGWFRRGYFSSAWLRTSPPRSATRFSCASCASRAQRLQRSRRARQSARACSRFLRGQAVDLGLELSRSARPVARRVRSSSMLSASRRARSDAQALHLGAQSRRGGGAVSRNCASSRAMRGALGAAPLFAARPARRAAPSALRRCARHLVLQALRCCRARASQRFFLLLARACSFSLDRACALLRAVAARVRARGRAAPAPGAPPRAANWRARTPRPACASRDRAPARPSPALCCRPRSRSSSASSSRDLALQLLEPPSRSRRAAAARVRQLRPSARAARASAPADRCRVFLPPLTAWP